MKKMLAVMIVLFFLVGCQGKDVSETAEEEPEEVSEPSQPEPEEETPAPPAEEEPEPPAEETVEEESQTIEVRLTHKSFDPPMIEIKLGDTVTWINDNRVPVMIAGPKKWFSAKIYPDESFSYTFEELGTHNIVKVVEPIFFQKVTVIEE